MKTLKKVTIKPSRMMVISSKDLERLRTAFVQMMDIEYSDIEFIFVEPPLKIEETK